MHWKREIKNKITKFTIFTLILISIPSPRQPSDFLIFLQRQRRKAKSKSILEDAIRKATNIKKIPAFHPEYIILLFY